MEINITKNNMFYRSYKLWNYGEFPDDICTFIKMYTLTLLFKAIPVLGALTYICVSIIYTLFTYNYTILFIDQMPFYDAILTFPGVVLILITILFSIILSIILIMYIAINFGNVTIGKTSNVINSSENIKFLKDIVASKFNKFCIRINVKQ